MKSIVIGMDVKDGIATTVTAQLHKDKTMTIKQISQGPTTLPNGEYVSKPRDVHYGRGPSDKGKTPQRGRWR